MYKQSEISCNFWFYSYNSLQVMDSSLQLPPPVTMTPLPSDVLLLETVLESPSGEWAVRAVSVSQHSVTVSLHIPHQWTVRVRMGIAVTSQLQLGLGLEQMLLHSHQH